MRLLVFQTPQEVYLLAKVFQRALAQNVMQYITIATTGNAVDFGDLTVARRENVAGVSNATIGVFGGGYKSPTFYNVMDYITVATTGNATDFGDLTVASFNLAGVSGTIPT
jgi:hypothetical protein